MYKNILLFSQKQFLPPAQYSFSADEESIPGMFRLMAFHPIPSSTQSTLSLCYPQLASWGSSLANRGGPYGCRGLCLVAELGVRKGQLGFPAAGPSCSREGWRRGLGRAWSKGKTSGHLQCRSPCPQTPLRKGSIFGFLPFSSFISTEEWLELCDLFHQHLRLKLNCGVLEKNELKPFLKARSAILMRIFYQEGRREKLP